MWTGDRLEHGSTERLQFDSAALRHPSHGDLGGARRDRKLLYPRTRPSWDRNAVVVRGRGHMEDEPYRVGRCFESRWNESLRFNSVVFRRYKDLEGDIYDSR